MSSIIAHLNPAVWGIIRFVVACYFNPDLRAVAGMLYGIDQQIQQQLLQQIYIAHDMQLRGNNETQLKAEMWADKAAWPQMGMTGLA